MTYDPRKDSFDKKRCSIEGCLSGYFAGGLCCAHYRRKRKHGDPLIKKGVTPGTVEKWMRENTSHVGDECLLFPFSRNPSGYGKIGFGGFGLAHRWMCHEVNGPSPKLKPFALHSCGKGREGCVNPRHLYWGNGQENYEDQRKHGVAAIGARHGKSTLTAENIVQIRELNQNGSGYRTLGKQFGVDRTTIRAVINGKTWRHVYP